MITTLHWTSLEKHANPCAWKSGVDVWLFKSLTDSSWLQHHSVGLHLGSSVHVSGEPAYRLSSTDGGHTGERNVSQTLELGCGGEFTGTELELWKQVRCYLINPSHIMAWKNDEWPGEIQFLMQILKYSVMHWNDHALAQAQFFLSISNVPLTVYCSCWQITCLGDEPKHPEQINMINNLATPNP